MAFFNKKENSKKPDANQEIIKRVENDLIVHNMPNQEKIVGSIVSPKNAGNISIDKQTGQSGSGSKSKMVGVVIIIVGVLVIAAIVFVSYKMVISPVAKTNTNINQVVNQNQNNDEVIPEKNEEIVIDNSDVIDVEVVDEVDIMPVESQASSTDEELIDDTLYGDSDGEQNISELADSDADGLYLEEEILLGTSDSIKDSDGDGYEDLAEIKNSYNPSGDGKLIDSIYLNKYNNELHHYSFLYPKDWIVSETNENLSVFAASDNSIVQVSVLSNENGVGILSWYEESFPNDFISYDNLIAKDGFEAVISKDGLNVYLTGEKRNEIIIISYIPAVVDYLSYKNIFDLIINSLVVN